MKTLALTVCALLVAGTAWADTSSGVPSSWDLVQAKNLVELTITQTDTLDASTVDTVVVDLGPWLHWMMTGNSTTLTTNCMAGNDGTAGDSLTVAVDVGMEFAGPWKTSGIALSDLNGQAAPSVAAVNFGRYFRFRIAPVDSTGGTNQGGNGFPYTLRIVFARGVR